MGSIMLSCWVLILAVFVVQICTIETCDAKNLGFNRALAVVQGSRSDDDQRSDFNCYDHDGNGYEGDIPHPSDCTHYLSCTVTFDGYAIATVMPCTENLQFHLSECRCEWPDSSKCFQAGHDYYESNRLRCAKQLKGSRSRSKSN